MTTATLGVFGEVALEAEMMAIIEFRVRMRRMDMDLLESARFFLDLFLVFGVSFNWLAILLVAGSNIILILISIYGKLTIDFFLSLFLSLIIKYTICSDLSLFLEKYFLCLYLVCKLYSCLKTQLISPSKSWNEMITLNNY